MKRFRLSSLIVIFALLLASMNVPCSAAEATSGDIGDSASRSNPGGTLPKGTHLFSTSQPSARSDYSSSDVASGDLTEDSHTILKFAPSLVAIENGTVKIAMPAITPEFHEHSAKGLTGVLMKANLISIKF